MEVELERDSSRAATLCADAEHRLAGRVAHLDDEAIRAPSLLPGRSVGHVLTHLARNADAHARRVAGALEGEDVGKYVAWDMSMLLATVPERMDSLRDRQIFMAWLAGRGSLDSAVALQPWG